MAEGDNVEVKISADTGEIIAAIADLKSQFKDFADETRKNLDAVSVGAGRLFDEVKRLVGGFLSFEAVKRAVDTTKELGVEAEKVAQRLGISQAAATQFAVAMDDIHASTDQVLGIMQRQNRNLKMNEDAMNSLGVVTRDGNGNLLSQQKILMNSVDVLNQYKAGTDRNQASMLIFGGRVGDLTALLKYNAQVQEEAKQKADELGLTMTEQGQKDVETYRKAMNDVGDVLKGLAKAVGQELMPLLSSMGNWFMDIGPGAIMATSYALKAIVTVLDMVWTAFSLVYEVVRFVIRELATFTAAVATSVSKWKEGPKAMAQAWHEGLALIEQEHTDFLKRMDDVGKGFQGRMKARWGESKPASEEPTGNTFKQPPDKTSQAAALDADIALAKKGLAIEEEYLKGEVEAKRMSEEAKLIIAREAQNSVYGFERNTLTKKLALYKTDSAQNLAERAKVNGQLKELAAQHVLDEQKFTNDLEAAQKKAGDAQVKEAERIGKEIAAFRAAQYKTESAGIQQRIAAAGEGQKVEEAYLAELEEDGKISAAKRLTIEKELIDNVYAYKRAAMADDLARAGELLGGEERVAAMQKLNADLDKLDSEHQVAVRNNARETTKAVKAEWETLLTPVTKAIGDSVKGMVMETTTLRQALANINQSIAAEFFDMCAKMLAKWIETQLAMKMQAMGAQGGGVGGFFSALWGGGGGAGAADAGAFSAGKMAAVADSEGLGVASSGGGGFFASLAAMIPSFDVGTPSVPEDMLAIVHKGERITPASQNTGAQGNGVIVNFNVHGAQDASSFLQNKGEIMAAAGAAMQRAMRRNR